MGVYQDAKLNKHSAFQSALPRKVHKTKYIEQEKCVIDAQKELISN